MISWVILELSNKGEDEAKNGTLSKILSELGSFSLSDIYIPIVNVGTKEPLFLIEGYIFIKTGYPSDRYWRLRQTEYIRSIISEIDPKTKMISKGVISDADLKKMIGKTNKKGGNFKVGEMVYIKQGYFKGLQGEVLQVIINKELTHYVVELKFRSLDLLVKLDCFTIEGI